MAVPTGYVRGGVIAVLLANIWWGFLPLLFYYLDAVNAFETVAARASCALVVVTIILAASRRLNEIKVLFADRRTLGRLVVSAALLSCNWLIYVYAVQSGHVLEGSFGYFITPMVNVGMGMLMLGERHSRWQALALGLVLVAIGIQAIGIGGVPFISLGLALSFGLYGYFRKTVKTGSTTGLFLETLVMTPVALAYVTYLIITSGPGPLADPRMVILLLATGPATAAPLLFYAVAVQRLRLTTIGMFQYVAPSIQFILAITFFRENLNGMRLFSFILVWISLTIFSLETWRRHARSVPVTQLTG